MSAFKTASIIQLFAGWDKFDHFLLFDSQINYLQNANAKEVVKEVLTELMSRRALKIVYENIQSRSFLNAIKYISGIFT